MRSTYSQSMALNVTSNVNVNCQRIPQYKNCIKTPHTIKGAQSTNIIFFLCLKENVENHFKGPLLALSGFQPSQFPETKNVRLVVASYWVSVINQGITT